MSISRLRAAGIVFACLGVSDVRAATPFDLTLCVAGPVTTIASGEDLTILGVELKGIAMSNHENKALDNAVYQFIGVSSIASGQVNGHGYSKITDAGGDAIFSQTTTAGPLSMPEWKLKFLKGAGERDATPAEIRYCARAGTPEARAAASVP